MSHYCSVSNSRHRLSHIIIITAKYVWSSDCAENILPDVRVVVEEHPVPVHSGLWILTSWGRESSSKGVGPFHSLQNWCHLELGQLHVRYTVFPYSLKGKVIQSRFFDSEVKSFCGGLCKDQEFSAGSEFQYLGGTALAVGALEWASVSGVKGISVGVKLSTGDEFQVFLLGLATTIKESSGGEINVKVVDEVKKITSIELEWTDFPIAVESGVKPPVGLQVVDDILIEAVQLIGLSSSIEATSHNRYSKEPGLVGTVMSHRCSS